MDRDESPSGCGSITKLLEGASEGDAAATAELFRSVYDELRGLARARLGRLPPGQTIQATELVHETWLRLLGAGESSWKGREHFFRAAAQAIRNILVERARRKASLKRDASRQLPLEEDLPVIAPSVPLEDVLSLHEALDKLARAHERPAHAVELHFFTGLSMPEVAELTGVSLATAERDWRFARAWLQHEMQNGGR